MFLYNFVIAVFHLVIHCLHLIILPWVTALIKLEVHPRQVASESQSDIQIKQSCMKTLMPENNKERPIDLTCTFGLWQGTRENKHMHRENMKARCL